KCHRSYIVNINHIDTYMSKEIKMHSGDIIPIARSYQKSFDSAYFAVFFGRAGEDE
ncbi:MAG: LytTR family transcriptional regulator DNA-binding domain-containing protein, partial [Oscillospiraceae bacterium]|nr:LytTR family transcriptional regulator DNA-binding domain-containing protein [Oscillospiraceae bacterium]